ncbi:flagellar protein [Cohnella pontilimi]|uniref:Flagellar protein n=1 Tax=Cohnella pontilimi TaxID=2564100 RepID=A0A4U0FCI8_9BACL|nr:TIGR03826 family flagellar region protein [Cohnella pontilimi]TJY41944.1 flagellar protein [Cohnella pontilimi]
MNLANCPRCGKLFSRQARNVCPNCIATMEKEYETCVAYLKENKHHCTMHDLSEATGVSVRQIKEFIREGRISMDGAPNMSYPCDSCEQPIREGHLCENCKADLQKQMKLAESLSKGSPQQQANAAGGAYQIGNRFKER